MNPTTQAQLSIVNSKGLHVRAATVFAQTASRFNADVSVSYQGERANGKSVMSLLLLTAAKGAVVTVVAEGSDAADALSALTEVIVAGFYEDN